MDTHLWQFSKEKPGAGTSGTKTEAIFSYSINSKETIFKNYMGSQSYSK